MRPTMALLHCLGETEGLSPLARSYWAPLLYSNTVFSRVLDLRLHCVTAKLIFTQIRIG